jgi:hypothetical protein
VNAWTWDAGLCSGIAGTPDLARARAAARLLSGDADTAKFRQVTVVTGIASLEGDYAPVKGTEMEGYRNGPGVRWRPVTVHV